MPSAIDATKPLDGVPASKADLRVNLAAAKSEIEALQSLGDIQKWDIRTFGVASGNTPEENDTGLVNLQNELFLNRNRHIVIDANDLGDLTYNYNQFLQSVGRVTLEAYGTSFQSVYDIGGVNQFPLSSQGWHRMDTSYNKWFTRQTNSAGNTEYGHLIASVGSDQKTVQLSTPAEAAEYVLGETVWVGGFNQQPPDSDPRSVKFSNYRVVRSVDTGAGSITLDQALDYPLDPNWFDVEEGTTPNTHLFGKPRIRRVRKYADNYWSDYICVKGATFKASPFDITKDNVQLSAEFYRYEDCYFEELYTMACRRAEIFNCSWHFCEIDKLVDDVYYDGCVTRTDDGNHFGGAKGTKRIFISRMDLPKAISNLLPMHTLSLDNVGIKGDEGDEFALRFIHTRYGTDRLIAKNLRFTPASTTLAGIQVDNGVPNSMTATTGTSGRVIVFNTTDTAPQGYVNYGRVLWSDDGRGGRIVAINGIDDSTFSVELDSPDTWSDGDTLFLDGLQDIIDLGGHTAQSGARCPLFQSTRLFNSREQSTGKRRCTIEYKDMTGATNWRNIIRLKIEKIEIDVISPDTSADAIKLQMVFNGTSTGQFTGIEVNTATPGLRTIDIAGTSGSQVNDSLDNDVVGNFLHTCQFLPRKNNVTDWGLPVEQKPVIHVRFTGLDF